MLKPVLLLSELFLFASVAVSFPGSLAQEGKLDANTPVTPESSARANKIYARDCVMCHGDNGNGQTDMARDMALNLKDWTDPKALAGKQDHDLFLVIRHGKDKMLPEDRDRASDDEVRSLILYIRSFSKPQTPPSSSPGK
jgi:mono/diheme cytochrome c family protein